MATYYINANPEYTESHYPYDSYRHGAKSFFQLFNDPSFKLQTDDVIYVYCPISDESDPNRDLYDVYENGGFPFVINKKVTIKTFNPNSEINARILYSGLGLSYPYFFHLYKYAENSIVSNLDFVARDLYQRGSGSIIYVNKCYGVSITNCNFICDTSIISDPTSGVPSNDIFFFDSYAGIVNGCTFDVPSNDSGGGGFTIGNSVFCTGGSNIQVYDNKFNMANGICKAMVFTNNSNIVIHNNVIYGFDNPNSVSVPVGDYFRCVELVNNKMVDIHDNVFKDLIAGYCGVYLNNSSVFDINQYVRNNVIIIKDDSASIAGIASRGNTSSYVIVYNNMIMGDTTKTYSYAFDISVNKLYGFVDYNCIYNIVGVNEFKYDGNPNNISDVGSHTIRENPQLYIQEDPGLDESEWSYYVCIKDSVLIGTGIDFSNIGLVAFDYFCSVVDTVIDGWVFPDPSGAAYLNVTTSIAESDTSTYAFRNNPVVAYFENQFEWQNVVDPFPFTTDSKLFKQNNKYVVTHRDLLWPFENITCPANPGRGKADGYVGYETGLFGYPRRLWDNGCEFDPCIIYDTFADVAAWQTVTSLDYTVQNTIDQCSTSTI